MMNKRKITKQYTFTVEGNTEKWYFDWLNECLKAETDLKCNVKVISKVYPNPLSYAKRINTTSTAYLAHICDVEGNQESEINRFKGVLDQLNQANRFYPNNFNYNLGYSNFTFELWMILHKQDCNSHLSHRTKYLNKINQAFNEKFQNLTEYKKEVNFKRCLSKLSLEDVKDAIERAKKIMELNKENGVKKEKYSGFEFYLHNPSLTIYEAVETIFKDCGLL